MATFMSANLFIKSPVSSDLPLRNWAWERVAPVRNSFSESSFFIRAGKKLTQSGVVFLMYLESFHFGSSVLDKALGFVEGEIKSLCVNRLPFDP